MLGALEKFMALTNLVSENEKIDDHKCIKFFISVLNQLLLIQILTEHLDQCIKKLWKKLKNLLGISIFECYNCMQKICKKLWKLRKSCNHKRNIKRMYNKQLQYYCLQQLPTLRLKT